MSERLTLTAAQTDVWFDEAFSTDRLAYTMADYLDVRGPFDAETFRAALHRLAEEAECTRSQFSLGDDGPVVVVRDLPDLPIRSVDLRGHEDPAGEAVAAMWRDLADPFDPAGFPLFRVVVFRVADERSLCYLAMHHLLCDGYSRVVLYRRLGDIYTALAAGTEIGGQPLAPLRLLLDAERAYAASPALATDRTFWVEQMSPAPEPMSLSARPATPATGLLRRSLTLGGMTGRKLRDRAAAYQVSWPAFVLAAATAYLGRAAGREDVLLTLPVAGRVGAGTRAVPGMVANYLPIRQRLTAATTVDDLLRQTSRTLLRTLRHQRYRVDKIRTELGMTAADRRPFGPFVNVLPQEPSFELGGAEARLHNLSTGIVDDLMITVLDAPDDAVEVHLNGNADRYAESELDDHLARYTAFLQEFAQAESDTPVSALPMVTEVEAELLRRWQGEVHPEEFVGVFERIRAVARSRPDDVAVLDEDGTMTYGELVGRANALSRRLAPGSVAAVLAPPGGSFITSVLATLHAGAVWAPLDIDAPVARSVAMLQDAGVEHLLVDPRCAELAERILAEAGDSAVRRTRVTRKADIPSRWTEPLDRPGDVAYIIFTSGSTGRPKGAMVHRGGLVNHLLAKVEDLNLRADCRVVQNAPVTFDVSVWQMLAPLIVGGTVRAVSRRRAGDPQELFGLVRSDGITVLEVVPSLLRAALDLWDAGLPAPAVRPTLRHLMVTGEAMPADLCERWFARHPEVPIINAYGPTECSDDVTHAVIRAGDPVGARVPIGYPVRNTLLYVLDDHLSPVGVGVAGELYVGGVGVGPGYVGDPVKTAFRFLADPFAGPGTRMYRTGDRVIRRADGQLEFIERRDHQVKIRGHRIELGEVEAALRAVDEVVDAAVAAVAGPAGTRLVAFVTGVADAALVRTRLASVLPDYMVPAAWHVVDALPLTAHGKVDRTKLLTLTTTTIPSAAAIAAPGDYDLVAVVREVFAAVLQLEQVAATDSFFALGGDSITAIQMVSHLRQRGVVVTPRDVLTGVTPHGIALTAAKVTEPPPVAADGTGEVLLTPIAAQLWEDAGDLSGAARPYSQHVVIRTPGGAGRERVAQVLQALVDTHDMLRMTVDSPSPGFWQQRVVPAGRVDAGELLAYAELPRGAGRDVPAEIERHLAAARDRLDPASGATMRAALLDDGDQPGWLLLVVHHLAVDGVSWRILLADLEAAWTAVAAGEPPRLEAVPVSYRRWAATLAEEARVPSRVAEMAYWLGQQAPAVLGTRSPDPAVDTYGTSATLRLELDAATTTALLTELPAVFHAEINDVLLTALTLAIVECRGITEYTVELEGHGREDLRDGLDLSRTVGWFTSVFPVRLSTAGLDPDAAWSGPSGVGDLLKHVKELLHAVPQRGVGHGLLRHLNPQTARLLTGEPPRIGFNYLGRFVASDGSAPWTLDAGTGIGTGFHPDLPLRHTLAVTPFTEQRADGPHLVADWLWAPGALDRPDAEEIAQAWFSALRLLVAHCRTPGVGGHSPSDFPLVSVEQDEVDTWSAGQKLTDVRPLTAIQRGMLAHSRFGAGAGSIYHLQVTADLVGSTDPLRLAAAMTALVRKYDVLRTGYLHRDTGGPVALVRPDGKVPWRELTASGDAELDRLADEDRDQPFDLDRPPLMRFTLARLDEARTRLIWTLHHIAVDGWSMPYLVRDLLAMYQDEDLAEISGPQFTDYLNWIARQDRDAARRAWHTALAGASGPTLVAGHKPRMAIGRTASSTRWLPAGVTAALTALAARHEVTVGTVVQACWALHLGRLTGRDDLLFGCTVSTRPAELAGIDQTVGMFLNTLPVRVVLQPGEAFGGLLRRVQDEQANLRRYDYLGLAEMLRGNPALAGVGEPYDTAVVFDNFPALDPDELTGEPRVENVVARDSRHYALSLVVQPGAELELRFDHAPEAIGPDRATEIAEEFLALLTTVAGADPRASVDDLAGPISPAVARQWPETSAPAFTPSREQPSEFDLRAVFAEVLGLEQVGATDNFFMLGGDSIAAVQVVARARLRGWEITPQDIFTAPQPAALAALAVAVGDEPAPAATVPLIELSVDEMDELDFDLELQ
ncbi:amino acid adenylation domain-containing protein [Micromonospora sp. NPDC049044]|uniref:amino acid adenylation domain-containing protein n=1 Tax=Micromonospora sp. NPDC049044 TaxID=3154827 RepID=UPI003407E221